MADSLDPMLSDETQASSMILKLEGWQKADPISLEEDHTFNYQSNPYPTLTLSIMPNLWKKHISCVTAPCLHSTFNPGNKNHTLGAS